jgi:hypothetical protein
MNANAPAGTSGNQCPVLRAGITRARGGQGKRATCPPVRLPYPQVICMSILSKLTMTSPEAFVLKWNVS